MKNEFIQAIKENDVVSVRLFLTNELLIDPRGATFEEMLKFAESHCSNLYDNTMSSFRIENEPENWNQSYLIDLKNEIDSHFLSSLLKHYKDVILVVLKDKAESLNLKEESKKFEDKGKDDFYFKIACGSLLLGGAALSITGLATAGICLSKGLLIKSGVVCLLSGSFMTYKLLKKNDGK